MQNDRGLIGGWRRCALLVTISGAVLAPAGVARGQSEGCPDAWEASTMIPTLPGTNAFTASGALDGAFEVSQNGSATYTIPLTVPAGRGGVQPSLSLRYDSASAESSAGVGFRLSGLSAVTRCGRTPAKDGYRLGPTFDGRDRYCLDGVRLVKIATLPNGSEEFRTYPDQMKRVYAHYHGADYSKGPHWFEVWDKNGRVRKLGSVSSSKVLLKDEVVGSWWVDTELDRHGNKISYKYSNEVDPNDGHTVRSYVTNIEYASHANAPATRRVAFEYASWAAHPSGYVGGNLVYRDRRLVRVRTYSLSVDETTWNLVRVYKLEYQQSQVTQRALLSKVQECYGEAANECNPPTKFGYQKSVLGFAARVEIGDDLTPTDAYTADVTGDGLSDLVYLTSPGGVESAFRVRESRGDGTFAPATTWATVTLAGSMAPKVIDYDMDGRDDLITNEMGGEFFQVYRARPDHTFEQIESGYRRYPELHVFHPADFHGAGRMTLGVCSGEIKCGYDGEGNVHCAEEQFWFAPVNGTEFEYDCNDKIKFVDVNGDGNVEAVMPPKDMIMLGCDGPGCSYLTPIYDPTHPDAGADGTVLVDTLLPVESINESTVFVDANGDGLPDAIQSDNGNWKTYLNTGKGFASGVTTVLAPFPTNHLPVDHYLESARPIDYNADGNIDLLVKIDNCPSGWVGACWYLLLASTLGNGTYTIVDIGLGDEDRLLVTDANADGRHDIILEEDGVFTLLLSRGPTDILTTVTDGMNALDPGDAGFLPNVSIEYGNLVDRVVLDRIQPGTQAEDDAFYTANWSQQANPCDAGHSCVAGAQRVVKSYSLNDGSNKPRKYEFSYRNGRYQGGDLGWLGFGGRIVKDVTARTQSIEFYDNFSIDEAQEEYFLLGRPYETRRISLALPTDPEPARVRVDYTSTFETMRPTNGGLTYFPSPSGRDERTYEGSFVPGAQTLQQWVASEGMNGATLLRRTVQQMAEVDDFGNVRQIRTIREGLETREVKRTFQVDVTRWLVDRVDTEQECSTVGSSTMCLASDSQYDQQGKPTRVWSGDPNDPTTQRTSGFEYDAFGNVVVDWIEDSEGHRRESCTTFDQQGVFPLARMNPMGHISFQQFDRGLGVRTATRDPNGLVQRWRHDKLGRLTRFEDADGKTVEISRSRTKTGGPNGNWWTLRMRRLSSSGAKGEREYDMLGRVAKEKTYGPSFKTCDGSWCTNEPVWEQTTEFDALGRVSRVSEPHLDGSPAPVLYSTYVTDALGRVIRETTPWNAVIQRSYAGNSVTVKDSGGTAQIQVDADDRPVLVKDKHGTKTTFVYGPFGYLLSSSTAGTQTSISPDARGRTRERFDPDRGQITFEYNGFDEQVRSVDALNREIENVYDDLGRVKRRNTPEGDTIFTFDPVGCKGCLASDKSPDGIETEYTYDSLKRIKRTRLTVAGKQLDVGVEYDAYSRPSRVSYPRPDAQEAFIVAYEYLSNGRVLRVSDDVKKVSFWELKALDGAGRTASELFGNSTVATHQWDPARDRLSRISLKSESSTLQDVRYTYDDRLNPTGRRDYVTGRQEAFTFDALDRLTCVKTSPSDPSCLVELKYEANGNIKSKSDVGSYSYASSHPHAVTRAGADEFGYDAVGNQITRPDGTIEYDAYDRPQAYHLANSSIFFDYDAAGRRVTKNAGLGGTTLYFPELYERITSLLGTRHRYIVPLGAAQAVVERSSSGNKLSFVHPEALGSTDLITDSAGQVSSRRSYDAFGARRTADGSAPPVLWSSPTTRSGFTGHESDDELDLVNMKGRIYDPRVGRFLQPDKVMSKILWSQRWNSYTYALNNPLRYVDPSGWDTESTGSDAGASDEASEPGVSVVHPEFHTVENGVAVEVIPVSVFGARGDQSVPGKDEQARLEALEALEAQAVESASETLQLISDSFVDIIRTPPPQVEEGSGPAAEDKWSSTKKVGIVGGGITIGGAIVIGGMLFLTKGFVADAAGAYVVDTFVPDLVPSVPSPPSLPGGPVDPIAPDDCITGPFIGPLPEHADLAPYRANGGHHPLSQAAMRGGEYNPNSVLTISYDVMEQVGINHDKVSAAQRSLFAAFRRTGQEAGWEEISRIEVEALLMGSDDPARPVNRALARDIVGRSALDHMDRCYAPTRVPGTRNEKK